MPLELCAEACPASRCVVGWGAAMVTYQLVFPYALVYRAWALCSLPPFHEA